MKNARWKLCINHVQDVLCAQHTQNRRSSFVPCTGELVGSPVRIPAIDGGQPQSFLITCVPLVSGKPHTLAAPEYQSRTDLEAPICLELGTGKGKAHVFEIVFPEQIQFLAQNSYCDK